MKVRMKVDVSGSRDGQPWPPRGEVVELPQDEAAQLCRNGMATPVSSRDDVETAVVKEPEEERGGMTKESASSVVPSPAKKDAVKADAAGEKSESPKETAPAKRGPGRPRKTAAAKPESGEK